MTRSARPEIAEKNSHAVLAGCLYTDSSVIRLVHGEGIVLLGGGRALLMQVAHPAVAAGVAQHSSFRRSRMRRLLRTLQPTLSIVFGTPLEVNAAARSINRVHEQVIGEGYRATDPDLLFWVLATLIDSAILMHDLFVRPLSPAETEAYYHDMCLAGHLLGIPPDYPPPSYEAFRQYLREMSASLVVSDTGRELARDIFRFSSAAAPAIWIVEQLSIGLLPPELRCQFGYGWGSKRQFLLRGAAFASRRVVPRVPASLRGPPKLFLPTSARQAVGRRRP